MRACLVCMCAPWKLERHVEGKEAKGRNGGGNSIHHRRLPVHPKSSSNSKLFRGKFLAGEGDIFTSPSCRLSPSPACWRSKRHPVSRVTRPSRPSYAACVEPMTRVTSGDVPSARRNQESDLARSMRIDFISFLASNDPITIHALLLSRFRADDRASQKYAYARARARVYVCGRSPLDAKGDSVPSPGRGFNIAMENVSRIARGGSGKSGESRVQSIE